MIFPVPNATPKKYPSGSIFQGLIGIIFQGILNVCQKYINGIATYVVRIIKVQRQNIVAVLAGTYSTGKTLAIGLKIISRECALCAKNHTLQLILLAKGAPLVHRNITKSKTYSSRKDSEKDTEHKGTGIRSNIGKILINIGLLPLIEPIRKELTEGMGLPLMSGT